MHSTSDPCRVRFIGPLAPLASGLVEELAGLGYARTSATNQMQLAAHLSRWLELAGLGPADLTGPVIDRFLVVRRRDYTNQYSAQALGPILGYLRRIGAVPAASPPPPPGCPAEVVLARFHRFLIVERSLTVPVADAYCHWVRPFVEGVAVPGGVGVQQLTALEVTRFLTAYLPGLSRKSAQMTACALRSFLRFLHAEGSVPVALAAAVPAVAFWKLSGLPQALTPDQVGLLLGACDPSTAVGRRDVAVIACLLRLGLRCGEVAGLRLDDVDWTGGVVTIRGKGHRTDQLPLPVDVGRALVGYLRDGRPATSERTVFVRAVAPFTALKSASVTCVVSRAARRAGLGTVHAHRLRHTAATRTLNAGASLSDVAQLLRHASPVTTATYAKTDLSRLAGLARPWPTAGRPW